MAKEVKLIGGPMDGETWAVENEFDDVVVIKPNMEEDPIGIVQGIYKKVESVWDGPGVHLWMGWNE